MRTAIISAMESEICALIELTDINDEISIPGMHIYCGSLFGNDVVMVICGEGKVNAAMCAEYIICKFSPDKVINLGIAGGISTSLSAGDIVIGNRCIQYDFDATSLGYEKGRVCNLDTTYLPCDTSLSDQLYNAAKDSGIKHNIYKGIIASGDTFVSSNFISKQINSEFNAISVDMESAAISQVCYINGIVFACVRAISDNGNNNAFKDFNDFKFYAIEASTAIMKEYFKKIQVHEYGKQ